MLSPVRLIRRGLAYPVVYLAMFWSWLLLAVWGAAYLARLYVFLQAPGVPAEFTYGTPAGDVVIRVESYALDPARLTIRAWEAQVTDSLGENQFQSDFITVAYRIGAIHATANYVSGYIARFEDGSFSFDRLLPDPDEEAEPTPLRVEIAQGDLIYTDLSAEGRIERRVLLRDAVLEQSESTLLSATASIDASPPVPIAVFLGSEGELWAESRFDGVDLAAFWPVIKAWLPRESLGDWYLADASRAFATGSIRVSSHEDGLLMRGSASVEASGVYLPGLARSASVLGTIQLEGSRVRTRFRAADGASTLTFDGGAVFGESIELAGNVFHSSSRPQDLPPNARGLLPDDWDYRSGTYEGYFEYRDGEWLASGDLTFNSLDLGEQRFEGVAGTLSSTRERLILDIERGVYEGLALAGAVEIDFAQDRIAGFFETGQFAIEQLLADRGFDAVSGSAAVSLLLSGSVGDLQVDAIAEGDLLYAMVDRPDRLFLGPFTASGRVMDGVLTVQRFGIDGPYGAATAQGTIDLINEQLELEVVGGGVPLGVITDELEGTAFFDAEILGTFDSPSVFARIEGYAIEYADFLVPQFVANAVYSGNQLVAEQFQARVGFGYVEGSGVYDLDSREVSGVFSSSPIVVSTVIDADVVGRVRVEEGVFSGTLDRPEAEGRLTGGSLLVFGVPVSNLESRFYVDQAGLELLDGTFEVEDGRVVLAGRYDFSEAELAVAGNFEDVPLSVIPFQNEQFLLGGTVQGPFSARIAQDQVEARSGSAQLQIRNFEVNSTPIGAGSLNVQMDGNLMTGSGSIGSIDRFILLDSAQHDLDTNEVDASIVVFNFPAETLIQILDADVRELPANLQATVLRSSGSISTAVSIAGEIENLTVDMESLIASNLEVGGRPAGELRTSIYRSDSIWIVEDLDWRVDDAVIRLDGTLDEAGHVDTVVSLSNLDLSWLNTFVPELAPIGGRANLTALLAGPTDDLVGRASLEISDVSYVGFDGTLSEIPVRVSVPDLTLRNDVIIADGLVFYQGLPGVLTANVPLSAFNENGAEPLEARLVLERRDLDSLRPYLAGIDYAESEGELQGFLTLTGTANDLSLDGAATLTARNLALEGLQTTFEDVDVRLLIQPDSATLTAESRGSDGGDVAAQILADYVNPLERGLSVEQFRDLTTVSGTIQFNDFKIVERVGDAPEDSVGALDGSILLSGLLVSPFIDADLVATDVRVSLPSAFEVGPETAELPLEPNFRNVVLRTGNPAAILTPIGDVQVEGAGRVEGSLSSPILRAPLTVVGGTFRLPTARIELEEGGSINVEYDETGGFEDPARIDVDITGTTRITARSIADIYESYEVSLNFRGNLMQDEGLMITAVSDPPGLSQDRILAIVGQQELIEALSQSVVGGRAGDTVREAIYTFAFPSLLGDFAQDLAASLSLDYVTLDYNPFDQAVIAAGVTITDGLMLQFRRQLSEPRVGPLRYEIKLSYRLPVRDRNLSRIRVGVAIDERVPWKITVDWGIRF